MPQNTSKSFINKQHHQNFNELATQSSESFLKNKEFPFLHFILIHNSDSQEQIRTKEETRKKNTTDSSTLRKITKCIIMKQIRACDWDNYLEHRGKCPTKIKWIAWHKNVMKISDSWRMLDGWWWWIAIRTQLPVLSFSFDRVQLFL